MASRNPSRGVGQAPFSWESVARDLSVEYNEFSDS